MRISPFPAVLPNLTLVSSNEGFFSKVKEQYREYLDNGFFAPAAPPAIYVYQIEQKGEVLTGLVAAVGIEDYLEGRIKKHEKTLGPKEQMQLELLLQRRAAVKPVLLAHRHYQPLADLLGKRSRRDAPVREIHFEDGECHRFWPITDAESIEKVQDYFSAHILQTYIADGHHRFSSAARLYEQDEIPGAALRYDSLMCALFPTSSLRIHNFNRVVDAFDGISPLGFMARMSNYGTLIPLNKGAAPRKKHEVTFCVEREWFRFQWHPHTMARHAEVGLPVMDVSLLNHCVLQDLLGIMDVRNDARIKYLDGPKACQPWNDRHRNETPLPFACTH